MDKYNFKEITESLIETFQSAGKQSIELYLKGLKRVHFFG